MFSFTLFEEAANVIILYTGAMDTKFSTAVASQGAQFEFTAALDIGQTLQIGYFECREIGFVSSCVVDHNANVISAFTIKYNQGTKTVSFDALQTYFKFQGIRVHDFHFSDRYILAKVSKDTDQETDFYIHAYERGVAAQNEQVWWGMTAEQYGRTLDYKNAGFSIYSTGA